LGLKDDVQSYVLKLRRAEESKRGNGNESSQELGDARGSKELRNSFDLRKSEEKFSLQVSQEFVNDPDDPWQKPPVNTPAPSPVFKKNSSAVNSSFPAVSIQRPPPTRSGRKVPKPNKSDSKGRNIRD
jgi:hypothetical protein